MSSSNQDSITLEQKLRHRGVGRYFPNGVDRQPGEDENATIRRALDEACQQIKANNPDEVCLGIHTFADAFQHTPDIDLDWSDLFPRPREWTPDAWVEISQALVDVRDVLARHTLRSKLVRIEGKLLLSAGFLVGCVFNQPSGFRLMIRQDYRDGRVDWWDSASQPLVAAARPESILVELRQNVARYFEDEELRTLCFDLEVDYASLPSEGKEAKARELVAYLDRRGRIADLIGKCAQLRPNIAWPEPGDSAAAARISWAETEGDPRAEDSILELPVSQASVADQVKDYVAKNNLGCRRRVEIGVKGQNVASTEEASAVALRAREALVKLKPPKATGRIHVFAAMPIALAVLIGQQTNAVGKLQFYEFRGEYVPSAAFIA